jgi:hypothetical protein
LGGLEGKEGAPHSVKAAQAQAEPQERTAAACCEVRDLQAYSIEFKVQVQVIHPLETKE